MKTKGTKTVKLSELQENLFVRKELNQDHVLHLAELIENGVKMDDLIEVTEDLRIVEGRHRKEAYELNEINEVQARVLEFEDEAEMIAYAYRANTHGKLPPTPQDTEHTIMLLLERGEPKNRIGELLGLPAGMARRYVNEVQSKITRAKLQHAATAIASDDLTVAVAAEKYGVDLDRLRGIISGNRKKHKQGVAMIQRNLTKTYRSLSSKNAALIRSIIEEYEESDMNEQHVRDIFVHLEQLQKRSARAVAGWKKRFEAMNSKTAKVA